VPSSAAARDTNKVEGDKNAAAWAAHDVLSIAEVLPERPPLDRTPHIIPGATYAFPHPHPRSTTTELVTTRINS
jgi:hypothetical protein